MSSTIKIAVIGDYDLPRPLHNATDEVLRHCGEHLDLDVKVQWFSTESLEGGVSKSFAESDGVWCEPGTPYKSLEGALCGIRFARENNFPFLGTCWGFQHTVIEYAQNKLGLEDICRTENDPDAVNLFNTPVGCNLTGQTRKVFLKRGSRAYGIYGKTEIYEGYNCSFGLNRSYQKMLDSGGLRVTGTNESGEARIVEVPEKRFFVATLFQPQLSSSTDAPHQLIGAYLSSAKEFHLVKYD